MTRHSSSVTILFTAHKCKIDDHYQFTEIYYQANYKSFPEISADILEPWHSIEPMIHGNRRDRLSPCMFTVSIRVAKFFLQNATYKVRFNILIDICVFLSVKIFIYSFATNLIF